MATYEIAPPKFTVHDLLTLLQTLEKLNNKNLTEQRADALRLINHPPVIIREQTK